MSQELEVKRIWMIKGANGKQRAHGYYDARRIECEERTGQEEMR